MDQNNQNQNGQNTQAPDTNQQTPPLSSQTSSSEQMTNPSPSTPPTVPESVPPTTPPLAVPSTDTTTTPPPTDPSLQQPTQTTDPVTPPANTPQPEEHGSSKKFILIAVLVVALLGVLGASYFLFFNKSPQQTTIELPSSTTQPQTSPVPTAEVGETPEEQAVIDLEEPNIEEEFQTLDQDLQQL